MNRLLVVMVVGAFAGCTCVDTCTQDSDCKSGRCALPAGVCTFDPDGGTAGGAAGGGAVGGGMTGGGSAGGGMTGGGSAGGGMTGGGSAGGGMTGGGSVGGGSAGGSTAGGMTGGGSVGGGVAGGTGGGGASRLCDGGCAVWAVCIDDGDAGRCDQGRLVLTEPEDESTYPAGARVPLLATLLLPDGGPWPMAVSIPVAVTWGINTTVDSGVASTVAGKGDAGSEVVRFGWSEGPYPLRIVGFTSCNSVACPAWQQCVPTVMGGRCENLAMTVSWTSTPSPRGPNAASYNAQVRIDADAGTPLPGMVPVAQEDGGVSAMLTQTSGMGVRPATYASMVTLSGPDGAKVLVAGWPASVVAGHTARQTVQWDATPPVVTLVAAPRPGTLPLADPAAATAWVKDEVANVTVTVTGNPSSPPTTSSVTVMGFNPMTAVVQAGSCAMSCTGSCVCLGLDLKDAPLPGLRGTVRVTVPAGAFVDAAGNQSLEQTADLNVTRVKWVRALPGTGEYRAAPAVDQQGNLYVGSTDNLPGTTGRVFSIHPGDAGVRWTVTGGAVQALAAANSATETAGQRDVVYVVSNEDNAGMKAGRLRAVGEDGGTTGLNSSTCQSNTRPMFAAPALVKLAGAGTTNDLHVGALGMFNSVSTPSVVDGNACAYSPATGNANATSAANARYTLPLVPTQTESAVNLVSNGASHYSVNNDFSVEQWGWGMSVPLASSNSLQRGTVGPTQTGLAFASSTLVTTQTQSGGGREPIGLVGRMLANPTYSVVTAGFTRAGPAVVLPGNGANNFLLVSGATDGPNGSWLRQQAIASADTTMPTFSGAPTIPAMLPTRSESLPTSPIYGDANQVYLVTRAGRLYVLDATTSGLTYAWDGVLPSLTGEVLAHPTLDCNRVRGSMAPGVLYTVSSQGTVAAVLVDSRRLAASPWPKWQRTAGNAGNTSPVATDFPLNPGCN